MELTAELEAAVWYSTILLLKLATAGLVTASSRFRRNVFANEEDVVGNEGAQLKHTDVVVERYRRLVAQFSIIFKLSSFNEQLNVFFSYCYI